VFRRPTGRGTNVGRRDIDNDDLTTRLVNTLMPSAGDAAAMFWVRAGCNGS